MPAVAEKEQRSLSGSARTVTQVAVAVLIGVLATLTIGPRPPSLDRTVTGDRDLAAQVRQIFGDDGRRGLAVAVVDGGQITYAGLGRAADEGPAVDQRTPFEIGSVTKGLTGLLLADLVADGKVQLDQAVGDLVPGIPLADSGDATLGELATHTSGLPRLPLTPANIGRSLWAQLTGSNPYSGSSDDVLRVAADAGAEGGGEPSYSNLGAATLGDALARHEETPYPDLLEQRILGPLGMAATTVATSEGELPLGRAEGSSSSGRGVDPWLSEGYAPAGTGTWSTTADLALLARALLDGSAPGAAALEPSSDYSNDRKIGLFWITSEQDGANVTWHNGATGGFRAMVALDRADKRAVIAVGNTGAEVDAPAIDLLNMLKEEES